MTERNVEFFSLPRSAPIAWPSTWPESVGIIVGVEGEKFTLHPCGMDEPTQGVLDRLGISDAATIRKAMENGVPASTTISEAIDSVTRDPDVLEAALDFQIAYDWSLSEGAPLEIPRQNEPVEETEIEKEEPAPSIKDPSFWSAAIPAADVRIVNGAKMRRSVPGWLAIEVPIYSGVEQIELEDIYVLPGASGILVREQHWNGIPGKILLPVEVLRHLDVAENEEVRIMKTENPGWVSFSRERVKFPSLADIARERDEYAEKGRKKQSGGRIVGLAVMIAIAITAFLMLREVPPGETNPIEDIRSRIFSTPEG